MMKRVSLMILADTLIFGFCYIVAKGFIVAFLGSDPMEDAFIFALVYFLFVWGKEAFPEADATSYLTWPLAVMEFSDENFENKADTKNEFSVILQYAWTFGFFFIMTIGFISTFRGGEATGNLFLVAWVFSLVVGVTAGVKHAGVTSYLNWSLAMLTETEESLEMKGWIEEGNMGI